MSFVLADNSQNEICFLILASISVQICLILLWVCSTQNGSRDWPKRDQKSEILSLAFSEQIHNVVIDLPCLQTSWLTFDAQVWFLRPEILWSLYYCPTPKQHMWALLLGENNGELTIYLPSETVFYKFSCLLHHLGPSDSCLLYYVHILSLLSVATSVHFDLTPSLVKIQLYIIGFWNKYGGVIQMKSLA